MVREIQETLLQWFLAVAVDSMVMLLVPTIDGATIGNRHLKFYKAITVKPLFLQQMNWELIGFVYSTISTMPDSLLMLLLWF